jgi:glycosyltransferase involved in cell wall biosynthesis
MKILFPFRFKLATFGGVGTFNNTLYHYISDKNTIYDLTLKENSEYDIEDRKGIFYQIKRKSTITYDLIFFSFAKNKNKFNLVHLSPSLGKTAIIRDGFYAKKCITHNIPFVVFFHGWDKNIEEKIEKNGYNHKIRNIFGRASAIWVLCSEFKKKLMDWGFDKDKIIIETTMVDDILLHNFDIKSKTKNIKNADNLNILFISRIIKNKGIYEAVSAFKILTEKYDNITFTIAGDGSELKNLKDYVKNKNISGIKFTGFISGQNKIDLLTKSQILFFPSYHNEGMPIAVLEAMAFGMPVITRKVAGLNDFFEHNKMGYYTESLIPQVFTDFLENLLSNRELLINMAIYNYNYAQKRFLASQVVKRIENVYKQVLLKK